MDNIQSNSQESIFKTRISNKCSGDTVKSITEEIDTTINEYSLDREKVFREILFALDRTDKVFNYYSFCTAVVRNIVIRRLDEFRKDWKQPNFLALHKAMEEIGMSGDRVDKLTIDLVETHILNEFPVEVSELIETNHLIIAYCIECGAKDYKDFLDFLLKSKLVKNKANVPLETLKAKAKEIIDIGNAYLRELSET